MSYFWHFRLKAGYLILYFLVLVLTGCFSRTGKENVPELTFARSPAPNASRVPINARIQLLFNALLDPVSLKPESFILMDPSGNIVPAKMDYSPYPDSGTSALILTPLSYSQSPPVYLNINTIYTVTLGAGIKTAAGNSMTLLNVWSFTTNNSPDFIPPTFGGAISAQSLDMGSIKLTWGPAVDNPGGTPSNQLVYSICYSTSPGICSIRYNKLISNPSAIRDSNGNFSFTITPLKAQTPYYFLVRVEDLAGNIDTNTAEVQGTTLAGKLYVSNYKTNEIQAYDHPSLLAGTRTVRSITASQNGLNDPYGIFYDQVNNRIYISLCKSSTLYSLIESLPQPFCTPGSSKIAVYDNTTTLPGKDQTPDRIILSSKLNGPLGIYLDNSVDPLTGKNRDTLYVANFVGKSVTILDNVTSSCQAAILPDKTCTLNYPISFVSQDLTSPFGIAYDSKRSLLYVSNYIQTFQTVDSTTGNLIPPVPGSTVVVFAGTPATFKSASSFPANKTISGFNSPAGIWLDIPGDTLYTANSGASLGPSGGTTLYPGIVAICNVSKLLPGSSPLPGGSTPCTANSAPAAQALIWPYDSRTAQGFIWPVELALSTASSSSAPSLYISDYNQNSVDVYSPNPLFSTSNPYVNTPPNEVIYGLNSEVQKPVGLAVSDDLSGNDNLYLANFGWDQILFFDQIGLNYKQCQGTSPSLCTFPSPRVISPTISAPTGIFLNNTVGSNGNMKDRLYISNFYNNTLVVMDNVSTLNGNSYNAIYKIISSPDIQNPFGIYVDTSQSKELIYLINARPGLNGMNAVLVFDLANSCLGGGVVCDNPPHRIIYSPDFNYPAGIWVDTRNDILMVSNRGQTTFSSPGSITLFSNSSSLNGTFPATKMIQGDQTSLLTPVGLLLDPVNDRLYVANQARNSILVFNQPQNCTVAAGTRICNISPTRTIYNNTDLLHSLDAPSSLALDYSGDKLYVSSYGLYNNRVSLLTFDKASTTSDNSNISSYFTTIFSTLPYPFQLNSPESIALDPLR